MRILQVTIYSDLQFGGPSQKVHALSHGLAARGHDVRVVTFRARRPTEDPYQRDESVEARYLPWMGKRLWQVPTDHRGLRDAVRWADVIHCYGLYNLLCPAAAFYALRIGRPYLLEPLGMYVPRLRRRYAKLLYHRLFTAWMAQGAAKVIATSTMEASELSGLVRPEDVLVRSNGLDPAAYDNLPSGSSFRERYQIGAEERILLYVGRISPIKNLEVLTRAFKQAALPGARLLLVGPALEAGYVQALRSVIAGLKLTTEVLLTGPLFGAERLAALAAADLFVLPSLYESFGNAAAEAVAAGLPVLLTQGCGIAPRIHGRAGLAVPPTAEALAGGMRTLLENAEQRALLTRARGEVVRELSWDGPLDQAELTYREVLQNGRPCMAH